MSANMKGKGVGKGESKGDAGKDRSKGGAKKGGSGGGGSPPTTMKCVMKFLTPEVLASGIIGKGGAVITAMRTSCNAKLALTEHGEFYPTTDCRVFTAQADEQESLTEVVNQVVAKLEELAKGATTEGIVGKEGELKVKTLVPRAACGGIIGKGGAAINKLREDCGATISVGEPVGTGAGAEQTVTIVGTADALRTALKEVNTQIQLLNSETWFPAWGSHSGVSSGGYNPMQGSMTGQMMPFGGGNMNAPGVDIMMRTAQTLPAYVMEDSRGFALSCIVPVRLVGGLIGKGGNGTKEIQMLTGTKIGIRDIPGDTENRSMNIAGPLASTCAAYMMMMKRYLDAEAASADKAPASR